MPENIFLDAIYKLQYFSPYLQVVSYVVRLCKSCLKIICVLVREIYVNFYNGCRKMEGSRGAIRRLKRQRNREEQIGEAPESTKCVLNGETIRTKCILKLVGSAP